MILDTNAVSALADGHLAISDSLAQADELVLPVIVLGEYRYGINQSRHRLRYQAWLAELIAISRILDVDRFTTDFYAAIRAELKSQGQPIPTNDLWIAALARQHRLPILSRNHHFDSVPGIRRLTWP